MKTKIGEKTQKAKVKGLMGWLKAYPGAAVLIAAALIGGVGYGIASMPEAEEEQVLETPPVVETPVEENKPEEEPKELVAKTIDETVAEIAAAGAERANITAAEEGLIVDVVLKAEATAEDVTALDDVVKSLLTDEAFVKVNLFESTEEAVEKNYAVNYMVGEEDEDADYISSAKYASNASRKGGMMYVAKSAWAAAEPVEVEEAAESTTTPSTTTPSTTTPSTTTPSTGNNTTGNQQQASQTQTPAQNQQPTQNQITPSTSLDSITGSSGSLSSKAKKAKSEINKDIIGWLEIPGTNISEPVTHRNDNQYYMTYNVYHQKETIAGNPYWLKGALIADYECNFNNGLPTNTIIYGHNWNNVNGNLVDNNPKDKMFAEVHKYADANFAANHPYIKFSTTTGDYTYQVFAAFYTHQNWTDYIYAYPSAERFANVLNTAKSKSLHNFGVGVNTNDKIISLSTCTRMVDSTGNYRFVVMAKRVG